MICLLSIGLSGCAQTQKEIIYVGLGEEVKAPGALVVATNGVVPVTIKGDVKTFEKKDVGGWFLVPPWDMKVLLEKAQEKK
jgi:hypothetical protein